MSDDSEQACLVSGNQPFGSMHFGAINNNNNNSNPSHQQQRVSQTSTQRGSQSESGDLIDDEYLISQFHNDAIKQSGCGKFQLLALIFVGMGVAGHPIQVYNLFYIVPSAEYEYCILNTEKNWLGYLTLLGLGIGAISFGALADRSGRKKSLLSCLVVSFVFQIVASFMPFYDVFVTARFFSAVGMGGVLPTAISYISELTPNNYRARLLGVLGALGISGGLLFAGIGTLVVPLSGEEIILEKNSEHFSAWHRYLLYCSLPTLASIMGLFMLPESPRYLLENNREVEALSIYQRIYRQNRPRGGYTLTELELPATRQNRTPPVSVIDEMLQTTRLFFGGFVQLFNKSYYRSTVIIILVWFSSVLVFQGLSVYNVEYIKEEEAQIYKLKTEVISDKQFVNENFTSVLDNKVYINTKFVNCSFRKMFFNHVNFTGCTFLDTEFSNTKSSRTQFFNSTLQFVSLIDTDLTKTHFVNCQISNLTVLRLKSSCDREFDYNFNIYGIWRANLASLLPSIILIFIMGEIVQRFGRSRTATMIFLFSAILSITFGFLFVDTQIIWVSGTAQGLILSGLGAIALLSVETYTSNLRCTSLGFFVCVGQFAGLIGSVLYATLPLSTTKYASIISTIIMSIPFVCSILLKDPCQLL